jgi:hypothetical protein
MVAGGGDDHACRWWPRRDTMGRRISIYFVVILMFAALAASIVLSEDLGAFAVIAVWLNLDKLALVALVLLAWLVLGFRRRGAKRVRTILLAALLVQLAVMAALFDLFGHLTGPIRGVIATLIVPGLFVATHLSIPAELLPVFLAVLDVVGFLQRFVVIWFVSSKWNGTRAKAIGRNRSFADVPPTPPARSDLARSP